MPVSWKKAYNSSQVIKKLENTRKIENGRVKFEGWEYDAYSTLIYSMLDFSSDIPEFDARQIVSKAIFISGTKGPITHNNLLTEICKLERDYQSSPIERYVLASSISMQQFLKIPRINFSNSLIIFEHSLPKRFSQESNTIITHAEQTLFASLPKDYLKVRAHVSAKSIHHAADQALEILDLTRGVWNWFLNEGHSFRMSFGGKPKPVNKIILGPLHTLHKPNGVLAAIDNCWYEPSYLGAIQPFSPNHDELEVIIKSLDHVKKVLKNHNYPQFIKSAIIRYTRALDERDWTTSFIKLWSILELLTDTARSNYEVTIRRTSFLYKDRDYHHQVLKHLRDYRNSSIHFDKGNNKMETYLYQIKNYVESLLVFHLNNRYNFRTIEQSAEFLDISHEEKTLQNQIEKLTFARDYLGYK